MSRLSSRRPTETTQEVFQPANCIDIEIVGRMVLASAQMYYIAPFKFVDPRQGKAKGQAILLLSGRAEGMKELAAAMPATEFNTKTLWQVLRP